MAKLILLAVFGGAYLVLVDSLHHWYLLDSSGKIQDSIALGLFFFATWVTGIFLRAVID